MDVTVNEYQIPINKCSTIVAEWLKTQGAQGVYVKTMNGTIVECDPLTADNAPFSVAMPSNSRFTE